MQLFNAALRSAAHREGASTLRESGTVSKISPSPAKGTTRPRLSMVWVKGTDGRLTAQWTTQD